LSSQLPRQVQKDLIGDVSQGRPAPN
jgi:hypothetical protein